MTTSPADENPSYEIQGQTIALPVEVRDAAGGIASFVVPSAIAQTLVGDAFEIAEFLPRRTLLMLACIDYKDNDLGDYNEVAVNFFVRTRGAARGIPYIGAFMDMGRGSLAAFSYKMPVNQSFTCEAGSTIWGFPKTVERIDFDYGTEGRFGALLEMEGRKVFELSMQRGGDGARAEMALESYSYINGIPHTTPFVQTSSGMGIKLGGGGFSLSLGDHPLAITLRELGLPKRPLMTMWTEKMVMQFGGARKL